MFETLSRLESIVLSFGIRKVLSFVWIYLLLVSMLPFSHRVRCWAVRPGRHIRLFFSSSTGATPVTIPQPTVQTSDISNPYEYHVPVMLEECMTHLNVQPGKVFVDGTLGGGGHTHEILKRGGKVIAFDQDPDAIARSSLLLRPYLESGQLEIHQTNFRHMRHVLLSAQETKAQRLLGVQPSRLANGQPIDGVLLDLGISSHQIDERSRGFSFDGDGPLDMRMHQGRTPLATEDQDDFTAAYIINRWNEEDIANLLFYYGDEGQSRRLARAIVYARPLQTTRDLEKVLSSSVSGKDRQKTLARCFQALRIRVNDELGALEECLRHMEACIKPTGRLVIMSYHSLEDRRVKHYLRSGVEALQFAASPTSSSSSSSSSASLLSSSSASTRGKAAPAWTVVTKRAVVPTEAEQATNRRSRSAKLRCAERVETSPPSPSSSSSKSSNSGSNRRQRR